MSDSAGRGDANTPTVSVIMANYCGAAHLAGALSSVLAQTVGDLEVIVSDDNSPDESLTVAAHMMRQDPRIRLVTTDTNSGPAKARNRALEVARGRWIAIVDSDDIIHPERLERLLAAADRLGADIVADDLLHFFEDGTPPRYLLQGSDYTNAPFAVTAELFIGGGNVGSAPALGYLKPLIRAERLGDIRYDETLKIGEDYDLLLRLLLDGARFHVVPEPWYLYRRHSGSISHRLSVEAVRAMLDSEQSFVDSQLRTPPGVAAAFTARLASMRRQLQFERFMLAVKGKSAAAALGLLAEDPAILGRAWRSLTESLKRRLALASRAISAELPEQKLVILGEDVPGGLPSTGSTPNEVVPPYPAHNESSWGGETRRRLWLRLAALNAAAVVSLDRSGSYAAGFIPGGIQQVDREAAASRASGRDSAYFPAGGAPAAPPVPGNVS